MLVDQPRCWRVLVLFGRRCPRDGAVGAVLRCTPRAGHSSGFWSTQNATFLVPSRIELVGTRRRTFAFLVSSLARLVQTTNPDPSINPNRGARFSTGKFKIGVTVPGDNSIDMYTNDIGLVAITDASGELEGFNVAVGG